MLDYILTIINFSSIFMFFDSMILWDIVKYQLSKVIN